jgi:hypothetical protein
LNLTGWVANSTDGVCIEAEGPKALLDEFVIRIGRERPEHAAIQSLEYSFRDPSGLKTFEIRETEAAAYGLSSFRISPPARRAFRRYSIRPKSQVLVSVHQLHQARMCDTYRNGSDPLSHFSLPIDTACRANYSVGHLTARTTYDHLRTASQRAVLLPDQ